MARGQLTLGAFTVSLFLVCGDTAAQAPIASDTATARLQALSEQLKARDHANKQRARDFASQAGFPLRREIAGDRVLELQRIAPGIGPVFYVTNNVDAADTVSTDEVWPGGSAGLDLDGAGMSIAEWDGGAVFPDHPDFAGRLTQVDGATAVSGHSTHVAGTLIGAGGWLLPEARGMAFAANLDAYDWNSDTAEMAAAAALGELVSNHSYGIAAGWLFIGGEPPDAWWWIGGPDPTDLEDPNFGYYDSETQLWDQIAHDAPYYLPVKASGNDRADFGASPGEEYTVIDQDGSFLFTSTVTRPADCAPAGYDCLPTTSVAKNVLTVGAVDDVPGGYSSLSGPGPVTMTDFSSWGPTDDGRIKPDVVGNGVLVYSTWHEYPYFALGIGTSMATPNVAGSLILLQQHYQDLNGIGNFMRASTLKALAIHTADETGNDPGPDYAFGWGLLNTKSAAKVITEDGGGNHLMIEATLGNGNLDSYVFTVTAPDSVLTATLVWTDPPGTPPAPSLDPPDLMLVNDLDLRIVDGSTTHMPWVLDPANPAAAATTGDNFRDNVEQVEVFNATPGSYTVEVSHKGALAGGASQDYALIISQNPPPPVGSGLLIDEDFSGGLPPGWSVQTTSGVPWAIFTPVPGGSKYDNLTGGSGNFAMVDNNFSNISLTSLRTPVLDLSTNTGAVLSFRSNFYFDLLETINVDISTNGGGTWTNVWQWLGFNPLPTNYVLDLSGEIAGHSNAMIRFRYNSGGDRQGNYWQVDDVELEVFGGGEPPPPAEEPPGMAFGPTPLDGAVDVDVDSDLAWAPGANAISHDVYFGTGTPLDAGDFQASQSDPGFEPGTLNPDTTYYWRVDEENEHGVTQGATWSFSTEAASGSVHLSNMSGSALPAANGRWTAQVTVLVKNQNSLPESGVTVDGNWSNGANGGGSCVTDGTGTCVLSKGNLKINVSSVDFTVTALTKAGMAYAPAENEVGTAVTVSQNDVDLTPIAADDSYQTDVDVPLSANVMENDDQGDGPASVESFTLPTNGSLSLSGNGSFSYTPNAAFEGEDSFSYRIVDQDGDLSDWATVTITVAASPPPGSLAVSVAPFKIKGVQHVEISWQNFSGGTVDITRDGAPIADMPTTNDGVHVDNIGVKGGGVTYIYEVCETGTGNCASALAAF